MKCPVCKTADLIMSERQSIEIDYCPECRGVWLDRGELDKILDRAQREFAASAAAPPAPGPAGSPAPAATGPAMTPTGRPRKLDDSDVYPAIGGHYQHQNAQQHAPHHPHQPPPYYYKKKKHWLLELLD